MSRWRDRLRRLPAPPDLGRGQLQAELRAVPRTLRDEWRRRRHGDRATSVRPLPTWVDRAYVLASLESVGGYIPASLGPEDVIVLAVVKDEAEHIEAFLEHHLSLGVRGVVLLDNGSEDETINLALRYAPVRVLRSPLPFRTYVHAFRAVLREQFGRGCWSLNLDADEHFDFPGSDRISLARLTGYLNAQGANLMLVNLLEMFAQGPLGTLPDVRGRELVDTHRFYDLSDIERRPAPAPLVVPAGVHAHAHGIRRRAFGRQKGFLHKLSMAFFRDGLEPWHLTGHHLHAATARVADISGVLYHYRFTRHLEARCRAHIASRAYAHDSEKAREYLARLEAEPTLDVHAVARAPEPHRGPAPLVAAGHMATTPAFEALVEAEARDRKVFCIGFHKTGTTSMGALFRNLGYRAISNLRTRDRAFVEALRGGDLEDLFAIADRANAFEDNPWPLFFRELDARYPGSRFILTVRDPEAWVGSVVQHFGQQAEPDSPMRRLIYGEGAGDPRGHEARYRARYEAHNAAVRAHFEGRPDDLLEVDVGAPDALARVCAFLDHETDLTRMPHENRKATG